MSELPPRAEVIDALLFAVLPSAVAAGGVYLLLALLLSRLTLHWRRWMPAASVLALAAAVAAGNQFRGPFPWWPDGRWWHWAGPAVFLTFAVEFVRHLVNPWSRLARFLPIIAAVPLSLAVVPPEQRADPTAFVPVMLAVALLWYWVGVAARVGGVGLATAGMAVAAFAGSAVLLHHKSIGFSDTLTVVGVALGTLFVVSAVTRSDPSAAAAVSAVPLVGMLALGRSLADSDIPRWVFVLAGGLPLVLVARCVPWAGRGRRPLLLFALTLVGAGVVVAATMHHEPLRFGDDW